jgi:hypothetical protein
MAEHDLSIDEMAVEPVVVAERTWTELIDESNRRPLLESWNHESGVDIWWLASETDPRTTAKYHTAIVNALLFKWTVSASGTDEYYLDLGAGGDPNATLKWGEPDTVLETASFTAMTKAAAGSLSAGEWAWGDNDTLGFNTVYVRLTSGGPDPDTDPSVLNALYGRAYARKVLDGDVYSMGASGGVSKAKIWGFHTSTTANIFLKIAGLRT